MRIVKADRSRLLLWIGVAGLVLTLLVTAWAGPHSAGRLSAKIEAAAQGALDEAGQGWAVATAHGQRVNIEGSAPDETAMANARAVALSAAGKGGLISGGVTKVTTWSGDVAANVSPYFWQAQRVGQALQLTGYMPDRRTRRAVDEMTGVLYRMKPNDLVELGSGAPAGVNWEMGARAGLQALLRLTSGTARLEDNTLTVTGEAATSEAAAAAREILRNVGGGLVTVANIGGPSAWAAALDGGGLAITGAAPTEDDRAAIVTAASRRAGLTINDTSDVGGSDGWTGRVLAAMPHFLGFVSGRMEVEGTTLRISGTAPGSVLAFLREDMAQIEDGLTVEYDVVETAPSLPEIAGVDLGAANKENCQEAFASVMATNQILFGTGDATISRESGETLDKLVEVARRCSDLQIQIIGHTDNVGAREKNMGLSRERAEAVMRWLRARDVPPERMTAAGYGPDRPIAANTDEAGRAQNRRIEFEVTSVEQP
jgi:OOP family OmpA-OmpF porin